MGNLKGLRRSCPECKAEGPVKSVEWKECPRDQCYTGKLLTPTFPGKNHAITVM